MGLFDQVIGAINNPSQQASTDQIGMILNTVQQMSSGNGLDPNATQAVMSVLGGHVRSALQQQRATQGDQQVESLVNQFAGTDASMTAVNALFSSQQAQHVIQDIAQKTGLDPQMIQSLLPTLVPIALNLLQSGANNQGDPGGNPVLNTFLDSDHDGDVDLGDTLAIASRFLNQPG
ncbi:MAG: hypothetical protein KME16_07290 [Scytolyngbya sp. HA4215-MV1]|jgi:hypothetical protein|nr:hypothetical protein [Scytolyngbya sp. HA4215-MV1]